MKTKRKRSSTSSTPKIENGVAIPPRKGREPSPLVKVADKMKPKQSFKGGSATTVTMLNKKLKPKRFSARVVSGVRRIWRVK